MAKYAKIDFGAITKMRYIRSDIAIKVLCEKFPLATPYGMDCILDKVPTADVQEVKHGEWLKPGNDPIDNKQWICSECKGLTETAYYCGHCYYNYCPNCGARMDGAGK